jgi:hypothetical protein
MSEAGETIFSQDNLPKVAYATFFSSKYGSFVRTNFVTSSERISSRSCGWTDGESETTGYSDPDIKCLTD